MKKFNVELMDRIICEQMVEKNFSYYVRDKKEMETVYIHNKAKAIEVLANMLGYQDARAFRKILRGKNACPHEEKMMILEEKFGTPFYLNAKQPDECNNGGYIYMNDIAKKAIISMYALTIGFFHSATDCVEEIENHLLKLEEFQLALPEEYYKKYTAYLREMIYDLPEIDTSDLISKGNTLKDEYTANVLIARHIQRNIEAEEKFKFFAKCEFAKLIQH